MTKEEFNTLPGNEQATLIAQDVIAQLTTGNLTAARGWYVRLDGKAMIDVKAQSEDELCDVLPKLEGSCRACALGSMLLSQVSLGNNFKVKDLKFDKFDNTPNIHGGDIRERLDPIFGDYTMILIETIFEEGDVTGNLWQYWHDLALEEGLPHDHYDEEHDDVLESCAEFADRYESSTERLIAIMQNIIDNGGQFELN